MVARIKTPAAISRALNYNEQKVQQGKADLLHAEGFLKDVDKLRFHEKIGRFKDLIALNERAKTNALHISLNFDNQDLLTPEKMVAIARDYMSRIGFGHQPYLVYQHHDSGHPHLHIVTTSIKADGKRIDTYNIGRNQSEVARKELEELYGLIRAESKQRQTQEVKPVNLQRAVYGKSETHRAITNVLDAVLGTYKYTSLPELNAVLRQYNVLADRGQEKSRIHQHGGLVYRILDEQGNKVGVPIKASLIHSKPTLKNLEQRFLHNKEGRQPLKRRVKNTIDLYFIRNERSSLPGLIETLGSEGISTVLRQNDQGNLYGITYVDHRSKAVFNGSDLGKEYSAKAIAQRCHAGLAEIKHTVRHDLSHQQDKPVAPATSVEQETSISASLLKELMDPEHTGSNVPYDLGAKKKKKKRKGLSI